MSKSEGKKISIKFTEELTNDISTVPLGGEFYLPTGIVTASNQYSSYSPERAFQEDSLYWYTRVAPVWIQIELSESIYISGFRWDTKTSTHRPKDFIVQGSQDGTTWDDIYEGISENINDWKKFGWKPLNSYRFYRWDISTKWGSYIYIYQIELLTKSTFTITGEEYKYVKGPLEERTYKVIGVEDHPTANNTILLSFPHFGEFNNVEGEITIDYDSNLGNLSGRGGAVADFITSFTPTDLVQTPNPGVDEYLTIAPVEIIVELKKVSYDDRYVKEYISVAPIEVIVELINVDEINP